MFVPVNIFKGRSISLSVLIYGLLLESTPILSLSITPSIFNDKNGICDSVTLSVSAFIVKPTEVVAWINTPASGVIFIVVYEEFVWK